MNIKLNSDPWVDVIFRMLIWSFMFWKNKLSFLCLSDFPWEELNYNSPFTDSEPLYFHYKIRTAGNLSTRTPLEPWTQHPSLSFVICGLNVLKIIDVAVPLRTEFPVFWEFLGIPRNSQKFPIMQMTLANWIPSFLGILKNSQICKLNLI